MYLSLRGFDTTPCEREEALKQSVDDQLGGTPCLHFQFQLEKNHSIFIFVLILIHFAIAIATNNNNNNDN